MNIDGIIADRTDTLELAGILTSSNEKFRFFLRERQLNVEDRVFLQAYEYAEGGERVYKRLELDSCKKACAFSENFTTIVDRSDYNAAQPANDNFKIREVEIAGTAFHYGFVYRTNRQNELVVLEASVLSLPTIFWERWVRQLEQSQPPYYERHPVYQEYVSVNLKIIGIE